MKTAVIYARVSTNRQADEGMSIDAQLKQLREYAKAEEYEVIREYVDRGESAKTDDRPQFQQMISDIKSEPNEYDAVLIHKTDRFARNREDSIVYKSLLRRDCDCDVIATSEDFGDGAIGNMIEGILEVIAEFYSENLSKEVLKGMREKAEKGQLLGKVAYGYKNIDGDIKIHENESEVVQWIFEKYIESKWSTKKIAYKIRHDGPNIFDFNTNIKSNGDEMAWKARTIRRILKNNFYVGTYTWNDTVIENNHTAIISNEQFNQANNLLEKRANSESGSGKWGQWLWSGIMKCMECGAAMRRSIRKRKTKSDRVYLSCVNHEKYDECYRNSHRLDRVEPQIINYLRQIDNGQIDISEIEFSSDETEKADKKQWLQKQLNKIDKKFDRQMEAYEADVITLEQLKSYQNRLQQEKEKLREKIKQLDEKESNQAKPEFREKLGNLADVLESDYSAEKKREFLLPVIDEVRLSERKSKINIIFHA